MTQYGSSKLFRPDDPRQARRDAVRLHAVQRGHLNHGDLIDLRQDHSDEELEAFLVEHYATPEGQTEAARAGMGGRDPRELARLVAGGR